MLSRDNQSQCNEWHTGIMLGRLPVIDLIHVDRVYRSRWLCGSDWKILDARGYVFSCTVYTACSCSSHLNDGKGSNS